MNTGRSAASTAKDGSLPQTTRACVLLVEDDATVAMLVEQILLDMELQVLVVATLEYAMVELEMASFDAAIIDMHLRGDRADQLIDTLLRDGIPFMIVSGGDVSAFCATHPQVAVLGKPFDKSALEGCVRNLLSR
ncbi:MAG: response regulator [Rhodanobacter sp.]